MNALKPARVVIVEDELVIANDLQMRLETLGYDVAGQAFTGERAVDLILGIRPDLVLMDIVLGGGLDGIQVAESVLENFQVPIIFTSDYADEATLDRAKRIRPFGYVLKPIKTRELKATLEVALYAAALEARQRLAEASLRASESRLEALYRGIPIPTFTWQVEGHDFRLVACNAAAEKTWAGAVAGNLGALAGLVYAEQPECLAALKRCATEQAPFKMEHYRLDRATGAEWYQLNSYGFVAPDLVIVHTEDITEKKRADLALKEREEFYRQIFHANQSVKFIVNPVSGAITDVNEAACRFYGYSRSELLDKTIYEINVRSPEEIRREMNRASQAEKLVFNFKHRLASGEVRDVEVYAGPITINRQRLLYSIIHDVTERTISEHLLRIQHDLGFSLTVISKLEEALTLVTNAVLRIDGLDCGGIYLADAETGLFTLTHHQDLSPLFVAERGALAPDSAGFAAILKGEPAHGLEGWDPTQAGDPCEREGLKALAAVPVVHEGQVQAILFAGSRTRHGIPISTRVALETIATRLSGVLGRLKADEKLRENEEKFRHLFTKARDGILIIDFDDFHIVDANEECALMYGYTRLEMLSMTALDLTVDPFQTRATYQAVMAKGESLVTERLHKRKNGARFPVELSSAPAVVGGRQLIFTIVRDITERKKAEAKLEDYQQDLRELAAELAITSARERRRIAEDLHDRIGQTLFLAKLKLGRIRECTEDQRILEAERMVGQLLDETAHDVRTLIVEISPPSLRLFGLVAALRELAQGVEDQHGLSVVVLDDGQDKPLTEDIKDLIFRAVREVLFNAVKHARAGKVILDLQNIDGTLRVDIIDDGIGFDPEALAVARKKTSSFGLFSLRERLGPLGGRLDLDSSPGQGTRASLFIPLKK
jgi:PAS domain S-box-containing protein